MKTILYFYVHRFAAVRRRLKGLCSAAAELDFRIQAVDLRESTMGPTEAVRFWNAVGLIVEGGVFEKDLVSRRDFDGLRLPIVYCDPDCPEGKKFAVCHDSRQTAKVVVDQLLSLNLPNYGFVGYRIRREWSSMREAVFKKAMAAAGKRFAVFDPCTVANFTTADQYFSALREWLSSLSLPCGIFAANDEMGENVIAAASALGLSVPAALAVIGVDDDDILCESTKPPLASIAPDFEESGRQAVHLLARAIRDPRAKREILCYGSGPCVMRGSMRMLKRRDYSVSRALEHIRLHAHEGIGVGDVAQVMGTGRRSAEMRFRRVIGRTIHDELDDARLACAMRLLSHSRIDLSRLHERCGYASGCVFRRFFKRRTGMTPGEWQRRALMAVRGDIRESS